MKSVGRRWRRIRLLLVAEAAVSLAASSLAIAFLSFERVTRLAARLGGGERRLTTTEYDQLLECSWTLKACARRLPWKAVCFQQGLALQMMLCRRHLGSTLHYGVAQNQIGLKAHVWVSVMGDVAIGGETAHEFAEVARFPGRTDQSQAPVL